MIRRLMRKLYCAITFISLFYAFVCGADVKVIPGGVVFPAAGGAAAWWEYGFESADACSNHFESTEVTPTCNDTTNPLSGTYDMLFNLTDIDAVIKDFGAALDEVWLQYGWYVGSAYSTTYFHGVLRDDAGTPADCFDIAIRDSTGYRISFYDNIGSAYRDGSQTAPAGGNWIYIRLHFLRNDSTGQAQAWQSTDGSSYTQVINYSGDTSTGTGYGDFRWYMGGISDQNYLFDEMKIYTSDPGW